MMRRPMLVLLGLLPLIAVSAERLSADKRAYTLGNPTPAELLRELTTDRPDSTETPFTIDAGHVQLEMDFASVERDRQSGVRTTALAVAPLNLRLGLRHNLEAGIFIAPYLRATEEPRGGGKTRVRGFGDITLRAKLNFWGNDGGESACGVFADVKLPTAASALGNDKVEGAITVPFVRELGAGWDLAGMTAIEAAHDGTRYQPVWFNTLSFAHGLVGPVSAFWEITSRAGDGAHVCMFDTGIAWLLDRNLQLDAGVNIGVSHHAPDIAWFAGVSRRF